MTHDERIEAMAEMHYEAYASAHANEEVIPPAWDALPDAMKAGAIAFMRAAWAAADVESLVREAVENAWAQALEHRAYAYLGQNAQDEINAIVASVMQEAG